MDEIDYLTTEEKVLNKLSECHESMKKLVLAMDQTNKSLTELIELLANETN